MNLLFKTLALLLISFTFHNCSIIRSNKKSHITTIGKYEILSIKETPENEESKGIIEGYVFDEYTNKIVQYGRVWELGNKSSIVGVDSLGYFSMLLAPGTYNLRFSSVGNKELTIEEIEIKKGFTTTLRVYLGSDLMYDRHK